MLLEEEVTEEEGSKVVELEEGKEEDSEDSLVPPQALRRRTLAITKPILRFFIGFLSG